MKTPQVPAIPGVTPLGLPNAADMVAQLESEVSASHWLKKAARQLLYRDCLDGLKDCERLLAIARQQCRDAGLKL